MNCELACLLLDDYLENQLSRYDRQRLEAHLAACPRCTEELHSRPAFEQTMWRGLAAAVQNWRLSPEASIATVRAAHTAIQRSLWSNRIGRSFRIASVVVALATMLLGGIWLLEREEGRGVLGPLGSSSQEWSGTQSPKPVAITMPANGLHLEPWDMRPRQPFTVTVFLYSDLPQPIDTVRIDLDITGPTGYYAFSLAAKGPFPSEGISVVRVTPDVLSDLCEKQYRMAATDIFRVPGVYLLRASLFSPVLATRQ